MNDQNDSKQIIHQKLAEKRSKHSSKDSRSDKASANNQLHVKIYSPFKLYFNDKAESISAENATGPFDILPQHHNFISILPAGEITLRLADRELRYKIDRAIMHVKADEVIVFLDV